MKYILIVSFMLNECGSFVLAHSYLDSLETFSYNDFEEVE